MCSRRLDANTSVYVAAQVRNVIASTHCTRHLQMHGNTNHLTATTAGCVDVCGAAQRTVLLFLLLIPHAWQQCGKAGGDVLVTHVQDGSSAL
jgi:hypothetical protein